MTFSVYSIFGKEKDLFYLVKSIILYSIVCP